MLVDVISQQVLIAGQITDAITGSRPRAPVKINVLRDSNGAPLTGVFAKIQDNGLYAVHLNSKTSLPAQDISLRLVIACEGYTTHEQVVAFTIAGLTRVNHVVSIDGQPVQTQEISGVPVALNLVLSPHPVTLKGRVSRAEDPKIAVEGANVSLGAPAPLGPVQTNVEGFFTLGPLPVLATASLQITAAGRDPLNREIRLDYRHPINQGAFALEPS